MDYIATQINEVMIELGYQFVSSKVLRRKNGSEYDCSLYQADEEAGVSIYTDESGAVMMQMTLLGEGAGDSRERKSSAIRGSWTSAAAHPDIVEASGQPGACCSSRSTIFPPRRNTRRRSRRITQGERCESS